jgi:hypothetical protein
MIEISPMLKILAVVTAFIARVLVGRKKRHREELKQRARAWQELANAIKRKEPPPVIQSLFAIVIGHDRFSVPLVKWILRQPDPLKAARWLLRVGGYVTPVKGGRLIQLKSVAANPPLRRRLIAAGIATYFPLAFISLWMNLYMAADGIVAGHWHPGLTVLLALPGAIGVVCLRGASSLYWAAKLVATQTK